MLNFPHTTLIRERIKWKIKQNMKLRKTKPVNGIRAIPSTDSTGAIDKWIDHRVGHSEEKYPHEVSIVDIGRVNERVHDKKDLFNEQNQYHSSSIADS